ncbi:hypothetical protein DFH01_00755 [Falsiroseomonas bella]|uniref:DUF4170 domain-containing protein n=1 Tax=Falsiroseomonas bella TaxID=2184016 RepID=A0A317FIU6_9PROT|nr:DUF4170 domain-containing protein [Falsiroseomonas bella]PWS37879.1 hypothetical protein DFH01_00755 [Falsiroseomonas bella]
MDERRIWVVWGGVFTDTSFTRLDPGTEELHGPFHDLASAERAWRDHMRRKVDIATHRLFVMEARATPPGA